MTPMSLMGVGRCSNPRIHSDAPKGDDALCFIDFRGNRLSVHRVVDVSFQIVSDAHPPISLCTILIFSS